MKREVAGSKARNCNDQTQDLMFCQEIQFNTEQRSFTWGGQIIYLHLVTVYYTSESGVTNNLYHMGICSKQSNLFDVYSKNPRKMKARLTMGQSRQNTRKFKEKERKRIGFHTVTVNYFLLKKGKKFSLNQLVYILLHEYTAQKRGDGGVRRMSCKN